MGYQWDGKHHVYHRSKWAMASIAMAYIIAIPHQRVATKSRRILQLEKVWIRMNYETQEIMTNP